MNYSNEDRNDQFIELISEVKSCVKCSRMCNSERVLGPASGALNAKAIFIGEAPGRLGADGSQIPFHGDKSGHNFEELLSQVNLNRYDIFVTNAVLCNPKDEKGNNATPSPEEIKNCSNFLKRQIDLINPPIIVTLGAVALKACALIDNHSLELKANVRTASQWFNRNLIPAYHPGQRAMIHRSFANQLSDYQFIAEKIKNKEKKTLRKNGKTKEKTKELIDEITNLNSDLSYFSLHKLFFLVEAKALDELGERLTESYIIRQKDGPYCVELHPSKLLALGLGLKTYTKNGVLHIKRDTYPLIENNNKSNYSNKELSLIKSVIEKYSHLSATELKRATYTTTAMRDVLRKEKKLGLNLFNSALLTPK